MDQVVEMDNLYLAWYKAAKGKQTDRAVIEYGKETGVRLSQLRKELMNGRCDTGNYHFFVIADPKVRTICAAPFEQRVMHHALMNICHHRFEKHLIRNTCATRKGKGTHAALHRATLYTKRFKWFVKADIRKYFDTIDHDILKNQLCKLFKDNVLLEVFFRIINSYEVQKSKGVPIGNLTSQYFANHYLSQADHFATEQLKTAGYVRYMDDILFFGNDRNQLMSQYRAFVSFVTETLQLEFKPVVHNTTASGVPFLGYKIFPYFVRLNLRSKRRFKKKIKAAYHKLHQQVWSEWDFQQHVTPLLAFVMKADTMRLRKHVLRKYEG